MCDKVMYIHVKLANSSIRKQKEQLKAIETPEEKRARRLTKKEAKERKKREKMGWDQEYMVGISCLTCCVMCLMQILRAIPMRITLLVMSTF